MRNRQNINPIVFIVMLGLIMVSYDHCIAQDGPDAGRKPGLGSNSIALDSIALPGRFMDGTIDTSIHPISPDTFFLTEPADRETRLLNDRSVDDLLRAKDSFVVMALKAFRYFSFGHNGSKDEESVFQLKHQTDPGRLSGRDFDWYLAFDVGYDTAAGSLYVNKIKASAYGFSTCLDAVYDYKNQGIDLFLSNSQINTLLMDGMKLELQISPDSDPGGALLLSMPF